MRSYDIDREELFEYYVNQRHSINECAEYFKTDYRHICTVLKGYEIKKNKYLKKKKIVLRCNIKMDDFVKYYITENHTIEEAAEYFGCSKSTIGRFIDKNKLHKPEEALSELFRMPKKYIVDKDELFDYYKIQKHTQAECAERFGVPKNIIRDNIKRNGWKTNEFISKMPSINDLYEYYIIQNNSIEETAQRFNISINSVNRIIKENNIKKEKFKISERRKQTCLKKHGVEYTGQIPESREKVKVTSQRKYGTDNPTQSKIVQDKMKRTCLKRYGVENALQSKEIQIKAAENARKSLIEKYGVPYASWINRSKEYIQIVSSRDNFRKFIIDNGVKTKKDICNALDLSASCVLDYINKYDSWDLLDKNISQPEEDFYKYLCNKYGEDNVFREYDKDQRYPFRCDFYIKSIDTFVELNLYITHGIKPYDPNDKECAEMLELYNKRAQTQSIYNSVIDNWTIRDVIKINTARNNNLNYVMYYKNDNLYDGRV